LILQLGFVICDSVKGIGICGSVSQFDERDERDKPVCVFTKMTRDDEFTDSSVREMTSSRDEFTDSERTISVMIVMRSRVRD
jgi:hypothetical protein